MMTNRNEYLFLYLLRSALWNKKADLSLFKNKGIDWQCILDIASKQGVVSLVASAIRNLEDQGLSENYLPNDIINKCVTLQFAIIKQTSSVVPTLENVIQKIRNIGIEPVLLKGHGISKYYFKPEFRYCCDIDLYLGEFVEKVVDELKECTEFIDESHDNEKHFNMRWKGVEVELHHSVIDLTGTRQNKQLYVWADNELHSNNRQVKIGETKVTIPSELFDSIYILFHLWWHFVNTGVGIRQFCDWTMCLYRVSDNLDNIQLKQLLTSFGMLDIWKAFGHVAVDQLGLPKEKFPLYSNNRKYLGRQVVKLALEYSFMGRDRYKQMVLKNEKKGVLVYKLMSVCFYAKLHFWGFVVSPASTIPIIKRYWKERYFRYRKKLH
jgi:hypothetical protein